MQCPGDESVDGAMPGADDMTEAVVNPVLQQ
jgi:hypothetical protein